METKVIRRALISVSNKEGIAKFAHSLVAQGIQLLSTSGTYQTLEQAGVPVTEISRYTGFPEIMGGRVKTLHPAIHGGILAKRGSDEDVMSEHGIEPIDMVVVNLYPFERTVARPDSSFADGVENIDIGGVALLRAAAKNHQSVLTVVSPQDYPVILDVLSRDPVCPALRQQLALKAFEHTANYDSSIARWLAQNTEGATSTEKDQTQEELLFEPQLTLRYQRKHVLRYGENPHQRAAFYSTPQTTATTITASRQIHGRELSFNNVVDADAAWECVCSFAQPACVIVKHANPCGVALAKTPLAAYEAAYATDPTSAFGGIIAFNCDVDAALVKQILKRQFVEVLIAPDYDAAAISALAEKPSIRALATGGLMTEQVHSLCYKQISGGMLVQEHDAHPVSKESVKVVSKRKPNKQEWSDLLFAWQVARFVKSNAIIYAKGDVTLGIGAGQMSRIMSARIAAIKAQEGKRSLHGASMASDAFFPFRDSIDTAAENGITAVIQPGGSKRDEEVISATNEHNMTMIFTGIRHFRHS